MIMAKKNKYALLYSIEQLYKVRNLFAKNNEYEKTITNLQNSIQKIVIVANKIQSI